MRAEDDGGVGATPVRPPFFAVDDDEDEDPVGIAIAGGIEVVAFGCADWPLVVPIDP
jgi:hypothetical protein